MQKQQIEHLRTVEVAFFGFLLSIFTICLDIQKVTPWIMTLLVQEWVNMVFLYTVDQQTKLVLSLAATAGRQAHACDRPIGSARSAT